MTSDDIETAEGMWGEDLSCLKALATRPKPDPVRMDQIEMPKEIASKAPRNNIVHRWNTHQQHGILDIDRASNVLQRMHAC